MAQHLGIYYDYLMHTSKNHVFASALFNVSPKCQLTHSYCAKSTSYYQSYDELATRLYPFESSSVK